MNPLRLRDQLFSALHTEVLKPRGYRKSGNWSVKHCGSVHVAVYLRSSRWNDMQEVRFWLDLKVFHEDWHTLLTGSTTFLPLSESTPSIIYEILGAREGPQSRQIILNMSTDMAMLHSTLKRKFVEHLIPMEEQCSSLSGILNYVRSSADWPELALSAAGICLLLGNEQQAREFATLAKECAPHENSRQWLEQQEAKMWGNRHLVSGTAN